MRNRTYGGVRGRKMTVGGKQPTSFSSYSILPFVKSFFASNAFYLKFILKIV